MPEAQLLKRSFDVACRFLTYFLSLPMPETRRVVAEWETSGHYPSISIIILNFRAEEATACCISSIARSVYPGMIKVVLVDNASTEASRTRLSAVANASSIFVEIVVEPINLGFAGGVLSGWDYADGELVCLFNNDAIAEPDCFRSLVDHYRGRTDLGAVWPFDAELRADGAGELPALEDRLSRKNGTNSVTGANIWLPILRDARQCFTGSGVCLLFSKRDVPWPFPAEYFAYYEDTFLGWRLQLRGLRVERVPEAVIFHEGSGTSVRSPFIRELLGCHAEKNRLANALIFYQIRSLLLLLPIFLLAELIACASCLESAVFKRPRLMRTRIHVRSRWWLLQNLGLIRRLRDRVQSDRRVLDTMLFPLMSGRISARRGSLWDLTNRLCLSYCRLVGINTVDA